MRGIGRGFWADLRYGARLLVRNPGFAAAAVLSLALGIGANTALFSVTDALMLRTLPVPHAEAIVRLRTPLSYPAFRTIRDRTHRRRGAGALLRVNRVPAARLARDDSRSPVTVHDLPALNATLNAPYSLGLSHRASATFKMKFDPANSP